MSCVIAVPEFVASAATDLANIGSTIGAANAAAAAQTTGVLAGILFGQRGGNGASV